MKHTETNETAQHTPGPWEFSPGYEPHFQSQIWRDDGKTIAVTYGDEDNANAKLIASAPELLEALLEAQKYLDELKRMNPEKNRGTEFPRIREAIQAAIAKATK